MLATSSTQKRPLIQNRSLPCPVPAPIRPGPSVTGSTLQKQAQWLTRSEDAARTGDGVEAELCRQYAEHWFRVSRGQE